MNPRKLIPLLLLAGFVHGFVGVRGAPAPALHYEFTPKTTNAYRVTLTVALDDDRPTLAGNVLVNVSSLGAGGVASVGFGGSLTPKAARNGFRPMLVPEWWSRPSYLSAYPGPLTVEVDGQGRVLRERATGGELPPPLGNLARLLFEPLPAPPTAHWQTRNEVSIAEDPALAGAANGPVGYMGNFYGDGRNLVRLSAVQTTEYRFTKTDAQTVTLHKRVTVRSLRLTGKQPRFEATGEGDIVFDRGLGRVRSIQMQCESLTTTETTVRRIPFTLRVESLEGDELTKALQPPKPEAPSTLKAAELEALLPDLTSDDQGKRIGAASRLMSAEIESPTPELLAAVIRRRDDDDMTFRMMAMHILGRYGQAEQVPVMIRLLRSADQGNRRELLDGLRRLKDSRAIEPLADLVARGGFDAQGAAEILGSFGPAAEDAALQLLKERNLETRRYACDILRQVGGPRSLEPLKTQMLERDQNLNQAATNAARAVQDRTDAPGAGR